MKRKIVILILAAVSFGILVIFILPPRSTQAEVIQYVFSNRQNYDCVVASTNISARLLHRRENAFNGDKKGGYDLDPPVQLSPDKARQIRELILAPSSYEFNAYPSCIPDYGVLFAFDSETQTVRVAVCFRCDQLGVFTGHDNNSEEIGEGNIYESHNKFLAIAKSIFTNAPEIEGLVERR